MGSVVEFRILGSFEVRVDAGAPLALGGLRQRALLAVLVLHANQLVSTDQLVDLLWGEHPPTTAVHTIQVFVSRLRVALRSAGDRLVTRPPGYVLQLAADEVDANRCERLYAEARSALKAGDAAEASTLLHDAEALWRGRPLAEFTYERFAEAVIARLEELRLSCREELIEAELALGRHRDVVSELEAFVREEPLRERPRGQLMLALYRCGRQADALDAYQQARRMLVDELAVEPSRPLRKLEQAILRQDPSLAAPSSPRQEAQAPPGVLESVSASVPEQPPATAFESKSRVEQRTEDALLQETRPIVGRSEEQQLLRRGLANAAIGRPNLVLVTGEAGIGKSRLVRDLAESAVADQAVVLWGECVPLASEDFPYTPIASALSGIDGPTLQSALSALPPRARQELANVFPEIGAGEANDSISSQPVPQSRLFALILALLRNLARDTFTLIVIEDLHWADPSTRDFVQFLVHSLRSERLVVMATAREEEPRRDPAIRRLLAELCRDDRVTRMVLAPLTKDAVARQLHGLFGEEPSSDVLDSVFARAEGNPFYTEALVAAGRGVGEALPDTIRDALLLLVEDLSLPAQELVRATALMGRPVEHEVLRVAADLPERTFLTTLRETIEQYVLVSERETGRLRFRHALLREAVNEDLNLAERVTLHAAIAAALEAAVESPNPAELASHREAAGLLLPALRAFFDAGLANSAVSAYSEALHHLEHALELWDRCRPRAGDCSFDRIDILARAAEAARWKGDFEHAQTFCRMALDSIDAAADPVRAASLYERLGRYQPWNVEASRSGYAKALSLLPDTPTSQRARLLADDARALSWDARWAEAKARAEAALEAALNASSPLEEGSAREVLGVATAFLGDPAAGERELRNALELVERFGAIEEILILRLGLADVLRLRGRTAEALANMVEGEQFAASHGADAYAGFMAVSAADDLLTLGRWPDIDQRLEDISDDALSLTGRALLAVVRGRLATSVGNFDRAAQAIDLATSLTAEGLPLDFELVIWAAVAEFALVKGRPEEARAAVSRGLAAMSERDDVLYAPPLLSLGARVEADLAERARAGNAPDSVAAAARHAQALLSELQRFRARGAGPDALPVVEAHTMLCVAELSRLEGASSGDAWRTAAEGWRTLEQSPLFAYATLREAEARLAADKERPDAADALRTAHTTASALGARPMLEHAEALARRSGVSLGSDATAGLRHVPVQRHASAKRSPERGSEAPLR